MSVGTETQTQPYRLGEYHAFSASGTHPGCRRGRKSKFATTVCWPRRANGATDAIWWERTFRRVYTMFG